MQYLLLLPVLLAFVGLEICIGGARLVYAIPGISLIAVAGAMTLLPVWKTASRVSQWALASALAFSAYVLFRNRLSEVDYIARIHFFIMAGCLVLYLLLAIFFPRPQERKVFFYVLMVLALAQVLLGAAQFVENNQWMPLPWAQRRDEWARASGFFISPNHFAGYLEVIALMSLSIVVWGRNKLTSRLLIAYVAFACVAGIAISGSRGGYLSFTFGAFTLMLLTLIAWHRLRPKRFVAIAIISSAAVVLLFAGIVFMMLQSPLVRERFLSINDPENIRLLLWESAIRQWQYEPWLGTGGFSFLYFGRLLRNPLVQNDPIHVHNDYLQLLADYGAIGLALFAVLLVAHLWSGGRGFRRLLAATERMGDTQSDGMALNIGALSCVAAYIVHSIVDFNVQIPVNGVLMGAIFAILASPRRSTGDEGSESAPPLVTAARWILPLGSVALLIYAIPMIPGEYYGERARVALRDNDPGEALRFARKALRTEKRNPDVYYNAGEALRGLAALSKPGKREAYLAEAVGAFQSGLEVFPYDSRLAVKLAQANSEAGDYLEASSAMATAEELDPNSSLVFAYRGLIELNAGFYYDAEAAFEQAIALGGEGGFVAKRGLEVTLKEKEREENISVPPPGIDLPELMAPPAEDSAQPAESPSP